MLTGSAAATEVQTAGQPSGSRRSSASAAAARSSPNGLAYSTASATVAQPQPPAGSCHARGRGVLSLPDPHCTPGALNPAVTQANIHQTICKSGWTSTVRPSESVTEKEKRGSLAAYGDTYPLADYEYDHLVSLELGGAVNDPRNLWPELGASFNPKDQVENELNAEVCDGKLTLAAAQKDIATNWLHVPGTTPAANPAAPLPAAPRAPAPAGQPDRRRAPRPPPTTPSTATGTYTSIPTSRPAQSPFPTPAGRPPATTPTHPDTRTCT